MNRALTILLALLTMSLASSTSARADIGLGQPLPAFTKTQLGGGTLSPSQYSGKVVVLALFGYGCPFCISDGPSVQTDLQQAYAVSHPGQVQVLGVDLWNGTASQVNVYRQQTGASYPLGLNGAAATGGNVESLIGTYDNYVVVNKQGIVRYHAALTWPHGNRYHLNEIRAAIDSLVTPVLDVPGAAPAGLALSAGPNPARGDVGVRLALPGAVSEAHVQVLDVSGRVVETLFEGPLAAGSHALAWRAARGQTPAGVYLVRARLDGAVVTRRVAYVR
jgi:hypothetical protein